MKFSTTELLIVLAVVVVIFGPTQIPKMLGKSIKNLRAGMSDDADESKSKEEDSTEQ